jgi:hypothetical protein
LTVQSKEDQHSRGKEGRKENARSRREKGVENAHCRESLQVRRDRTSDEEPETDELRVEEDWEAAETLDEEDCCNAARTQAENRPVAVRGRGLISDVRGERDGGRGDDRREKKREEERQEEGKKRETHEVRLLISVVVVLNVAAKSNKPAIPSPEQKSGTKDAIVRTRSCMFFFRFDQF